VPGHLQNKLPVATLIDQLPARELSDGQTAQDQRPRAKTQVLVSLFALDPDEFNALDLAEPLFGYDQFGLGALQDRAGSLEEPCGAGTLFACSLRGRRRSTSPPARRDRHCANSTDLFRNLFNFRHNGRKWRCGLSSVD